MEKNIGIDFGTTNTVIYSRDMKGRLKKIGGKSIRSAIYFLSRDEYIIGEEALKAANCRNCQALVTDFKPRITEKIKIVPENGKPFQIKGEAIAKIFLNKILSDAIEIRFKKLFGTAEMTNADKTVITVPAKFDAEKKSKIKKAARNAMFSNVGIAFEPTAAAIAACDTDDDMVAVYDFGGGTFDVSVIEKGSDDHYISVDEDGDPNLGGNLITEAVLDSVFLPLLQKQGFEISSDIDDMEFEEDDSTMSEDEYIRNIRDIKDYIEQLKEYFSECDEPYEGKINLIDNGSVSSFFVSISKEDFNRAIMPYIRKTVDITRNVIERIRKNKKYVKKIIMAGGSSQLSLAEQLLKAEFEDDGIEIVLSDSVFDLIAKGALLMAEQQKLIRVEEKTATQFGVGVRTGVGIKKFDMLIDVGQPLPVSGSKRFKIDGHMLQVGLVDIPCYEKDFRNYPRALTEREKGISHINTYHIGFDSKLNPSEIEVLFTIETDGTLNLSALMYDQTGKVITDFNAEIMSDDDIE